MSDIIVSGSSSIIPPLVPPTAPTVSFLLDRTKQYLLTGQRESRNRLSNAVNAAETSLTFTFDLGRIASGARVCIDLEDMYVWTVAAQTAEVERGQFGSTADLHDAGSMVFVDPRYSNSEIFRALQNTFVALNGMGLWQMLSVDLTYDPSIDGYDLTGTSSSWIEEYQVLYDTGIRGNWRRVENFIVHQTMPTSDFPSARSITIFDGGVANRTIRVQYRAKFSPITALDNDVTALGLPYSALDLLPLGAAIRLTSGTEIRRNDITSQGDTKRPSEVPAGAALRSNLGLQGQFQSLLKAEVDNLSAQYPPLAHNIWNW